MITKITDEVINRLISGDVLGFYSDNAIDTTIPNGKIYYDKHYDEFVELEDTGEYFSFSRTDVEEFKNFLEDYHLENGTLEWEK